MEKSEHSPFFRINVSSLTLAAQGIRSNVSVTDPLLSVAVFQVIYIFVIPEHSNSQQVHGEETIFSQDHKICEEPSCGLHHT